MPCTTSTGRTSTRRMKTRPLPRHPAPRLATVTLLDAGSAPITTVPVAALAYTRALAPESVGADATTAAVQVCAHFERHGACNRGHRCRFAHAQILRGQLAMSSFNGSKDGVDESSARATPATSRSTPASQHVSAASSGDVSSHVADGLSSKVLTSRGWRHAAYYATPRAQ